MAIESSVVADAAASLVNQQTSRPTEVEANARSTESVKPETVQEAIAAAELAKQQAADAEQQQADQEPLSHDQLEVVVQQLQDFVETLNRGIAFTVDQESGKDVIKVTNRESGELVRQIPSEEVLLLASRLSEATGLLVNTEV